jgi:hypothetical protein
LVVGWLAAFFIERFEISRKQLLDDVKFTFVARTLDGFDVT